MSNYKTHRRVTHKRVVINTRPIERAKPLSAALTAANYEVLSLPLLALNPRPISTLEQQFMQRWSQGRYAVTVIVSPTAATLALKYWQQSKSEDASTANIANVPIVPPNNFIAVGGTTASVLRQQGIAVQQPIHPNNEGMLEMPLIAGLRAGDEVLIWRGLGGRRLLVETLRQRGVQVDTIAWYERVWPSEASHLYGNWLAKHLSDQPLPNWSQPPIVIISSGAAFEHWQQLIRSPRTGQKSNSDMITSSAAISTYPRLADFVYVVLGERLATLFKDMQLQYQQVESLDPKVIIEAAAKL